ncbi:MAG: SulP family inorganic anion transporter [Gemmatimonadetes bacterium]|nr:SulP family inorganic anion transporter [Gemmatimonadota bacterium]
MSVALVLVPQSLAYAELAGLPGHHGLWAAAAAPLAAALLASSPFLQTGPVAVTSLLTLGALVQLAPVGSERYVGLAALLAIVVGLARLLIGLFRVGWISYLMSQPVILGFMTGASVLIAASQLPALLGVRRAGGGVLADAVAALVEPSAWSGSAVVVGMVSMAIIVGLRRLSPRVPGVLVAALGALLYSHFLGYTGPVLGGIDAGLPPVTLRLPWTALPALLLPGVVISLVGFADVAAIARTYATRDRQHWDPDREFLGQGVANLAAGLVSGYPVGGSFARSSLGRSSGGRTRWTGFVTGAAVLGFLPFAGVVAALPSATLAAIVLTATWGLIDLKTMARVMSLSVSQGLVALTTFATTLLFAPRIDLAVVVGIATSLVVHAWRELRLEPNVQIEGDVVHVAPQGVLWFASAPFVEPELLWALSQYEGARKLRVDLKGLGRIDLSGALALRRILDDARDAGLETELVGVPLHAERMVRRVLRPDDQDAELP